MEKNLRYNPQAGLFKNPIFRRRRVLSSTFIKKIKRERTLGYLMKCKRTLKDALAFNELQRDFLESKKQDEV